MSDEPSDGANLFPHDAFAPAAAHAKQPDPESLLAAAEREVVAWDRRFLKAQARVNKTISPNMQRRAHDLLEESRNTGLRLLAQRLTQVEASSVTGETLGSWVAVLRLAMREFARSVPPCYVSDGRRGRYYGLDVLFGGLPAKDDWERERQRRMCSVVLAPLLDGVKCPNKEQRDDFLEQIRVMPPAPTEHYAEPFYLAVAERAASLLRKAVIAEGEALPVELVRFIEDRKSNKLLTASDVGTILDCVASWRPTPGSNAGGAGGGGGRRDRQREGPPRPAPNTPGPTHAHRHVGRGAASNRKPQSIRRL